MSIQRFNAVILCCLFLIGGIYTGSTSAYVSSLSATCVNTFSGEVTSAEETTAEHSSIKTDSNKKSPATGNTEYKYIFVLISFLFLALYIIIKRRKIYETKF